MVADGSTILEAAFLKTFDCRANMKAEDIRRRLTSLRACGFLNIATQNVQNVFEAAIDIAETLSKQCVPAFTRLGTSPLAQTVTDKILELVRGERSCGEKMRGKEAL